ncbi:hypothetical protein LIER_39601 [Lithospermum erythrorhizon]|uniref:Uncharacterized protein n=1 Tax=Lithospermum erythrorhizon TaxID=34254 RepID=A0AAV3QL34_LITER
MYSFADGYDEYFSTIVHVGGSFKLKPALDYIGATTVNFHWTNAEDFDVRDIDEYAMRAECPIGGKTLYAYAVEGRGFGWLKPLPCEANTNEFRKLAMKENFMDVYIDCKPNPELLKLYSSGCGLRTVVPREKNKTKGQSSKESNDKSDLEFLGDLTQDIEYENDVAFVRESDLFDDDLDKEIREENIVVQQKEGE